MYTDPGDVDGPIDVVFVAVKDTPERAGWSLVGATCDAHTVVCPQNGVEQLDRVGRFCPSSTVVPAAVWISSEIQPDGWVRVRNQPRLVRPDTEGGRDAAELLRGAG